MIISASQRNLFLTFRLELVELGPLTRCKPDREEPHRKSLKNCEVFISHISWNLFSYITKTENCFINFKNDSCYDLITC